MTYVVVYVTASSEEEGKRIAEALVNSKLAACVNLIPRVSSTYWWQGKVEHAQESFLVIKTMEELLKGLIDKVKELHSYTVPEIIALPIIEGSESYFKWIKESLK